MGLGPGRLRPPSLRAAGLTADELFTHVHRAEQAAVLRR
jgi:hypothetical protein